VALKSLRVSTSPTRARTFLLILLIGATVLVAAVVRPLLSALLTAIVLAAVLWPLHMRFAKRLGKRRQLSASLITTFVVLLLTVPMIAMSAFIVDEAGRGIEFISETVQSDGVTGLIEKLPPAARKVVKEGLDLLPRREAARLDETVKREMASRGDSAAVAVGAAVYATGDLLFQTAMMLIAFFFLLLQGDEAVDWIESVSPLRDRQTRELLIEFKHVAYALVVSTVVTSAVQAGAALIGFLITSVPAPVFFTMLTFIFAFVPAVGAAAVCQFAALLLLATGHSYAALFLSLWGFIVVGLVDNAVKPYLIKNEIEMPGAVVFFALIGGLAAFGGVGLLIGPLATAFFITLVRMYRRDYPRASIA
jgi:predicted PurR-regulated permease PerM